MAVGAALVRGRAPQQPLALLGHHHCLVARRQRVMLVCDHPVAAALFQSDSEAKVERPGFGALAMYFARNKCDVFPSALAGKASGSAL